MSGTVLDTLYARAQNPIAQMKKPRLREFIAHAHISQLDDSPAQIEIQGCLILETWPLTLTFLNLLPL